MERLLVCEDAERKCWFRTCAKCSNSKVKESITGMVKRSGKGIRTQVKWFQWKKNEETNRFQKIDVGGTLNGLINYFMEILPEFLKHSHVKRTQAASFETDTEDVIKSEGKVALVQIDFAECFTCEAQEEIQSAHWNQATVG